MKRTFLLFFLVLAAISIQAQNRTDNLQSIQAFAKSNLQLKCVEIQPIETTTFSIYNIDNQGFIILSNSKNLPPVLAYSDNSVFPSLDEAPENIRWWMEQYEEMSLYADEHPEQTPDYIKQQWADFENGRFLLNNRGVNPLVQTLWNQDCYYNEYCPTAYGGPCNRVYAGCVACAMAQVMKYHNHPQHGFGSHSYHHNNYGLQTANFGETTYDWNNMPDEIYSHNDAIATLMYHCGVSVDMNYSPSGSGAQSKDVETALRSYFGYCSATYRERSKYEFEEWRDMVRNELDNARPIYYSGANSSAGHAFVLDGYNASDYYHFNWGWSGYSNGYYSLYDVNGWTNSQAMVVNIRPMVINSDENGIIYVSPDGQGDGSSWENATSELHFANARSIDGTRIWVKKGTYFGDDTDPENAFSITYGNRIYGSFNGDEAPDYDLSQRDFINNASILDGQNEKRVLNQASAFNAGTASVWDGFTITNGATGSGAGVYLNDYVTISNCIIDNNHAEIYGGGIYINAASGNGKVIISNCIITNNTTSIGAGVCDRYGTVFSNCIISNNVSSTKGGGLYIYNNAEPTLKGCIISNNTAKNGAGMYARGKMTVTNCDFVMNEALESSGGIFSENRYSKYTNCIVWGNKANGNDNQIDGEMKADYCAIQGDYEGENMIVLSAENDGETPDKFVRFAQPAEGTGADYRDADWSLMPRSICLNAGKPNTTGLGENDLFGNFRIQNGRIEIGAYESCSPLNVIDVTTCSSTYNFNGTILDLSGYYTTAYETSNCDSIVGLNLTFNASTMEVTISGNLQIHIGESTTLTASGAENYLWSTGETTASITVSPTEATEYTVTGFNSDGCEAQTSVTVYVDGTSVNENDIQTIEVTPNPANDKINVKAEDLKQVVLYNVLGQMVGNYTETNAIDVSTLTDGMYFMQVECLSGMKVCKVIIRH